MDNAPGHPRIIIEMYEINIVFMPAKTTSILQPMNQEVISNFMSHSSRNTFYKSMAAIDCDSSDEFWQSQLKIAPKKFTILDAINNNHGKWLKYQQ